MNDLLNWAVHALQEWDFKVPADEGIRQALQLAGIPNDELDVLTVQPFLSSLFNLITLKKIPSTDKNYPAPTQETLPTEKYYPAHALDTAALPEPVVSRPEGADIQIPSTTITDDTDALAFLEKYGSYVAASSTKSYLPFYDVIRLAAAIYAGYQKTGRFEFSIISGDLSGIQHYIFNLNEGQSKHVAKVLRARSFYLGMITDICQHYILQHLEMPLYCSYLNAGGRFQMLVPQIDEHTLAKMQSALDNFFYDAFNGELSLNLAQAPLQTETVDGFSKTLAELSEKVDRLKYRSLDHVLMDETWNEERWVLGKDYKLYQNDLCPVSGKLPAQKKSETEESFSKEIELQIKLGQHLINKTYIAYQQQPKGNSDTGEFTFSLGEHTYSVDFLVSAPTNHRDAYYRVERLESGNLEPGIVTRHVCNYVPRYDNFKLTDEGLFPFQGTDIENFCISMDDLDNDQKPQPNQVMDFGTFAYAGVEKMNSDNNDKDEFLGSRLLGVVKADVDFMGRIFSNGLGERFELASYASLSRQMDLFFTGYLSEIQRQQFKYMYTVYSGGDDLFFVGEWQQAIQFAVELYQAFKRFTGQNDAVHLSSAVYVMKPHHPIRSAAEAAEEMLSAAKNADRDKIAFFSSIVPQQDIEAILADGAFINKQLRSPDEKSKINSSFLHRLLYYRSLAVRFIKEDFIQGLMYIPKLAYDLRRNIAHYEGKDLKKHQPDLDFFDPYLNSTKMPQFINLEIAIFKALYRNRKIRG